MKTIAWIGLAVMTVAIAQDAGSVWDETSKSGSIGSVTVNGEIYHQVAFRPEIPIGKIGIGLDIYFYFGSDGNIYQNSWDFSTGKSAARSLIDKIYYIRYGQPMDSFYFRAGALPEATLGQGILVDNYSNLSEYPSIRRIGLDLKAKIDDFDFEYIQSDFKELPGLIGLRATYPLAPGLDAGLSFVTDVDQFAGLIDSDGDDYPDLYDHYPDDDELYNEAEQYRDYYYEIYQLANPLEPFEEWFLNLEGLNHNRYDKSDQDSDPVSGVALDLTYALTDRITLYSQFGQLIGETRQVNNKSTSLGFGFVPIGISGYIGPLTYRAEFRHASRNFVFNYWDRSYDLNRVVIEYDEDTGTSIPLTKESQLYRYGQMNGFYAYVKAEILNLLHFSMGYQDMTGETWDDEKYDYADDSNETFLAELSLNTAAIPKIRKASAFYQQSNVPNPFDFKKTPSTIHGYDVGMEISEGVMLVYQNRTTYVMMPGGDLESMNSMQIETQILF